MHLWWGDSLHIVLLWQQGSTWDPLSTRICTRCYFFLFFAGRNIRLVVRHVSGLLNSTADARSRLPVPTFRRLHPSADAAPPPVPLQMHWTATMSKFFRVLQVPLHFVLWCARSFVISFILFWPRVVTRYVYSPAWSPSPPPPGPGGSVCALRLPSLLHRCSRCPGLHFGYVHLPRFFSGPGFTPSI